MSNLQPLDTLKDHQVILRQNHGLNLDICLVGNQNLHASGAILSMHVCDDRLRMRNKCDQTVSLLTLAAVMSSIKSQTKHWLALEAAAAAAAAIFAL